MPAIRTNRLYAKLPDTDLSRLSGKVAKAFTEDPIFANAPFTGAELTALKKTFDDAIIKADKGGSLATALKNAARAALIDALNKDASFVDIQCDGDITILLSSGYEPVSTNRAQRILNPPQVIAVENGQSGELRARIRADASAKAFQGRIKLATGGDYGPVVSFKNSRSILFKGLTAGLTYVFQLCAIGGSTGQSDWSEPGSGMAQ